MWAASPLGSLLVAGAVAIVVVLLLIPVAVVMSGAVLAAILGWSLKTDAEDRNEGSELIELNA
ncbi:hypothetical protein B7486_68630 [cyanobacterium TDX16]|nr:hypothetical protein B7486_68630 [cyanobacterium TDX16]